MHISNQLTWPNESPRGTIVALLIGFESLVKYATSACPPSWNAVISLFLLSIMILFLSGPIRILSLANSRSVMSTASLSNLAA